MGQAKQRKAEIEALKAGPDYFYHGTTVEAAEQIIKSGILDPKMSVKNKHGHEVVMITDSAEAAVNITAIRKTQDLKQEVVVFKFHKSKLDNNKLFKSNGTYRISIMKNFKGWYHMDPIDISDAEVIRAKPTFTMPNGVKFIREGNKSGFAIDPNISEKDFMEAVIFCGALG